MRFWKGIPDFAVQRYDLPKKADETNDAQKRIFVADAKSTTNILSNERNLLFFYNFLVISRFPLHQFVGHFAKIVLIALGKIAWSGEADRVGHLGNRLVTLGKHLLCPLESNVANEFDRRIVGQRLGLAVELCTAHAHHVAQLLHAEVRIAEAALDDFLHLEEELVVEGRGGSERF